MPMVKREELLEGFWVDRGALPCPRCRSAMVAVDSHPACGVMATCMDCGGRGHLSRFNDGWVDYVRAKRGLFQANTGDSHFERPAEDVIQVVPLSRSNAELSGAAAKEQQ